MSNFRQYEMVRVRQLIYEPEHYDGWKLNLRSPAVGDEGTIVDILHAAGLPDCFIVECSAKDGRTIWLGDFHAEELESAELGASPNGDPGGPFGHSEAGGWPPSVS
jgi:hypothetical protein